MIQIYIYMFVTNTAWWFQVYDMNISYRNAWLPRLKYCCLKWIEGNYSALPKGQVETTHQSLPLLRYWNSRKYRSNDTWMAMDLVSLALDDPRKMHIMTFCMRHENQTKLTDSFVSNTHELGANMWRIFCFLQDNSPFKTMTWRLFWTIQRSQETCETSDAKVVSQIF